jgi:hypothetical protein
MVWKRCQIYDGDFFILVYSCTLDPEVTDRPSAVICLNRLSLSGNSISDIGALQALQSLEHLDLSDNAIGSLEAIRSLSGLRSVNLSHNHISVLSDLSQCSNLQVNTTIIILDVVK